MARRWTLAEDAFLVAYFDAVGAMIGPHDLGRTEAATEARVKQLKEHGGWQALEQMAQARKAYYVAMHPGMSAEEREIFDGAPVAAGL